MDFRLVSYNVGIILLLFAFSMIPALFWSLPFLGGVWEYEAQGVIGLVLSVLLTGGVSVGLIWFGKSDKSHTVFRKEAIAIVGISWILASIFGAMPYLLSGTIRGERVDALGRVEPIPMSVVDSLFESISGITTSGATTIADVEDPAKISRTILFWRSTTHFVGGLGIIVLLVALLDTGMAGKLLVQREMTGPKHGVQTFSRTQMIARRTVIVYLVLNAALVILLSMCGIGFYDALCFGFGTIATGGLAVYNDSFAHFRETLSPAGYIAAEWIMTFFMFLSGSSLLALFFLALGKWQRLIYSTEWRVYVLILLVSGLTIAYWQYPSCGSVEQSLREGFFHCTSIATTTGYATTNYVFWLPASQAILVGLMFTTSCAGSTAGGPKVIRHILLFKLLRLEMEKSYRPAIVRPLYYNGERISDPSVAGGIFFYFTLAFTTLLISWILVMIAEPSTLWEGKTALMESKSMDLFAAVISHFSNVGPALGSLGPMDSFGKLSEFTKFVLLSNMLLGRLDFIAVLVLFSPSFWKK
ncbi:MAG: TrkH family potassium uptake protein [Planctomycetia bacterium]|nr:TrkH family potassium uptake protein [Planctomycetia bacterium]